MNSKKIVAIDSNELLNDPQWVKKITNRSRENFPSEVAQVLFGARLRMGMTQGELAKKIGTTQSVIARNESGRSLPGLSFVDRVARAYKTNARIVFESMPEVVPVSVRYSHLNSNKIEASASTRVESTVSSIVISPARLGSTSWSVRQTTFEPA